MEKEYREMCIEKAIEEINAGSKVNPTAFKYSIPERTLRRRLQIWRERQKLDNHLIIEDVYFDGGWMEKPTKTHEKNSLEAANLNVMVLLDDIFSDFKDYSRKCCLCFREVSNHQFRITFNEKLQNMVDSVLQLQLLSDETDSSFLCMKCNKDLNYFHKFKSGIKEKQKHFEKFKSMRKDEVGVSQGVSHATSFDEPLIKIEEIKSEPEFASSITVYEPLMDFNSLSSVSISECKDVSSFDKEPMKSDFEPMKALEQEQFEIQTEDTEDNSIYSDESYQVLQSNTVENRQKSASQSLTCEACGKIFKEGRKMRVHYKRVHLKYRPYHCDICGQSFFERKSINNHMGVHISKEYRTKDHQCEFCSKGFYDRRSVMSHIMKCHGETGEFPCSICSKIFPTHYKKRYHERTIHANKSHRKHKEFVCESCGKVFRNRGAFIAHMNRHHNIWLGSEPAHEKFTCDACGKQFYTKSDLYSHQRVHKEKNIQCDFPGCLKKFKSTKDVRFHKKFHNPDRKIPCTYPDCNKSYFSRQHLSLHIFIHHQNIREPCPVGNGCKFSVGRRDYMKNHLKKHKELSSEELDNYIKMLPTMNLHG
ncbi:CLUMA_CG000607, isoform A [Clunio marinus]|uniref:CLUMA_CG000607, isoform A n=1 Tax=Clunio marinus TaxID=568069 RepID=A0A1J1HFM8_9DIPT|nr:CLUMA_CG000607, isoform A [Clunio marinus]